MDRSHQEGSGDLNSPSAHTFTSGLGEGVNFDGILWYQHGQKIENVQQSLDQPWTFEQSTYGQHVGDINNTEQFFDQPRDLMSTLRCGGPLEYPSVAGHDHHDFYLPRSYGEVPWWSADNAAAQVVPTTSEPLPAPLSNRDLEDTQSK
jgi:hypothetical protein